MISGFASVEGADGIGKSVFVEKAGHLSGVERLEREVVVAGLPDSLSNRRLKSEHDYTFRYPQDEDVGDYGTSYWLLKLGAWFNLYAKLVVEPASGENLPLVDGWFLKYVARAIASDSGVDKAVAIAQHVTQPAAAYLLPYTARSEQWTKATERRPLGAAVSEDSQASEYQLRVHQAFPAAAETLSIDLTCGSPGEGDEGALAWLSGLVAAG